MDPNVNLTLFEYLQKPIFSSSLSALGLDVGQNRNNEKSINWFPNLKWEKNEHSYTWDASTLSSGMYYIKLVSGNHVETMKAVLMK